MKKLKICSQYIGMVFLTLLFLGCDDNQISEIKKEDSKVKVSLRATIPENFDWENPDFMPTPDGTMISTPWKGAGIVDNIFDGSEVLDDRKKENGWVLLYNTFSTKKPLPKNPYFMLYNKYNGLLRVFLYVNTDFVGESNGIKDFIGVSTKGGKTTSLLNFLGDDIVESDKKLMSVARLQPNRRTSPLAANKWYMFQYELAYDPNIQSLSKDEIKLFFNFEYLNVAQVKLNGEQQGNIKAIYGASSNKTRDDFFLHVKELTKPIAKTAFYGMGEKCLDNHKQNPDSENKANNDLGLPNHTFTSMLTGMKALVSLAQGNTVKAIEGLLDAIIFGGSGNGGNTFPANFKIDTKINLDGNITSKGRFPSMPLPIYVPGTQKIAGLNDQLPLYDSPLGVLNFNGRPNINIDSLYVRKRRGSRGWTKYIKYTFPEKIDYSNNLLINPQVKNIASVEIVKQDIVVKANLITEYEKEKYKKYGEFPDSLVTYINQKELYTRMRSNRFSNLTGGSVSRYTRPNYTFRNGAATYGVRFLVKIAPKDGSSPFYIMKTFVLNPIFINAKKNK